MIVLFAAGCGGDPAGSQGALMLEALDGSWTGTALATSQLRFPFSASFFYDEADDPPLQGQATVESYLFDVKEATSDAEWADLVMLNPQGRAHLELSGVQVVEPQMTGHFEMDLCWATDPGATSPQCHAEGNFSADRQ